VAASDFEKLLSQTGLCQNGSNTTLNDTIFFCAAADLPRGIGGQIISYLLKKQRKNCKRSRYQVENEKPQQSQNKKANKAKLVPRQLGKKNKTDAIEHEVRDCMSVRAEAI